MDPSVLRPDQWDKLGSFALLGLFVLGMMRQWWVMGWHYKDSRVECEKWETRYFQLLETTRKSVELNRTAVDVVREKQQPPSGGP